MSLEKQQPENHKRQEHCLAKRITHMPKYELLASKPGPKHEANQGNGARQRQPKAGVKKDESKPTTGKRVNFEQNHGPGHPGGQSAHDHYGNEGFESHNQRNYTRQLMRLTITFPIFSFISLTISRSRSLIS